MQADVLDTQKSLANGEKMRLRSSLELCNARAAPERDERLGSGSAGSWSSRSTRWPDLAGGRICSGPAAAPRRSRCRSLAGKRLYGVSCTGCHGADLRGGDLGGPNLLRSQVALSDRTWRIDSADYSGQPAERGHACDPHESGRWAGGGGLCSQRRRDHRQAGHAAIGREGTAEHSGRRCQRRASLLRRKVR